jgi:hypothetical protein
MKTEELEQLVLLYERVAVEKDDRKLMVLVEEINRLLEEREKPPTVN